MNELQGVIRALQFARMRILLNQSTIQIGRAALFLIVDLNDRIILHCMIKRKPTTEWDTC